MLRTCPLWHWYRAASLGAFAGAQFFCARREVWRRLAGAIPERVPSNKNIDSHVSLACHGADIPLLVHLPTLVRHDGVGDSTLGHTGGGEAREGKGWNWALSALSKGRCYECRPVR